MARRTKREQSEYVRVYYGINSSRGTVETVWEQRDSTLVLSRGDGTGGSHFPLRGRTAEHEMLVVWNITDTFCVIAAESSNESTKQRIRELQLKATEMKGPSNGAK